MGGDVLHLMEGGSRPLPKAELNSVTIIGMGATSMFAGVPLMRGDFPRDECNQVWAINAAAKAYSHDLAWNTHDLNELARREKDNSIFGWYKETYRRPVATLRPVDGMQTLIYPLKEIFELFQDTYWVTAPPYMMAYAYWCGARTIRLFGLDYDYLDKSEYEAGRCCTEYWMGRLRSLGVKFEFSDRTTLMDQIWQSQGGRIGYGAPFYGYFDQQPKILTDSNGRMTLDDNDPGGDQVQPEGEDLPRDLAG